jgi:uncharacterized protein YuzE
MTRFPYVRVDLQHKMLSVMLNDRDIARTDQLDDAHLVDVDAEGHVVGLDIMSLDNLKIEEMAERFGFSDQVAAIRAAIRDIMAPSTGSSGTLLFVEGVGLSHLKPRAKTEDTAGTAVIPPVNV